MVWVETTAHIIQDPATQHLKVLFFIRDIDKEKKHELILQYQSQRDSLTGLLNKGSTEAQILSLIHISQLFISVVNPPALTERTIVQM